MLNTDPVQSDQNSQARRDQHPKVQQPRRGVWQDKHRPARERVASPQAAPDETMARARLVNRETPRLQKQHSSKRKTVPLHLWVKPRVKAELERIAEQERLSVSATGAAFLEKAIQNDIHTQHGALLETVIDQAISRGMRSYSNRLALLLVRVAFDAGQTRALVTNLLGRQPGVTPDMLTSILDGSSKTAKANIARRTPQLEAMIREIAQWLAEQDEYAA